MLPPLQAVETGSNGRSMPTYEYRCRHCGREFEVFQRMSDQPAAPCPDCEHVAERLISGGAGLLFKGEGFYITDHRSASYRERAREEEGGAAGKSEASGAKKDAGTGTAEKTPGSDGKAASAQSGKESAGDAAGASPGGDGEGGR